MKRANRNRLKKMTERIEAMPILPAVEDAAFERFRETGELPDHERLAGVVIERALRGGASRGSWIVQDMQAALDRLTDIANRPDDAEPEPEPLRKILFHEAVYGPEPVRIAARQSLEMLVAIGRDVTDPEFIPTDTERPEFGTVGLYILGFPECLAKPPYEEQAHRLFRRLYELRERIDHDDRGWFDRFGEAANNLLHRGELPEDKLMRESVLANGELMLVLQHRIGTCDAEVMGVYDQVGVGRGKARAGAVGELQAMGAAGRLVLKDASA